VSDRLTPHGDSMPSYLVERYAPRSGTDPAVTAGALARAAAELAREGISVVHRRTTLLPEDETCFHLVEAYSRDAVEALCRRAALGHVRIVAAIDEPDA